jgi:hypothetical protein
MSELHNFIPTIFKPEDITVSFFCVVSPDSVSLKQLDLLDQEFNENITRLLHVVWKLFLRNESNRVKMEPTYHLSQQMQHLKKYARNTRFIQSPAVVSVCEQHFHDLGGWLQTVYGMDIGFTDQLYAPLETTLDRSPIHSPQSSTVSTSSFLDIDLTQEL